MSVRATRVFGRLRRFLAPVVLVVAVATIWIGPGLVWREVGALAPLQQSSVDSQTVAVQAPGPAPSTPRPVSIGTRLTGLLGLAAIIGLGIALSNNRRRIDWRVVVWGLGLQTAFAIFVLRVPAGQALFRWLGNVIGAILHFSYAASAFVFETETGLEPRRGVRLQILPAISRRLRHPVLPVMSRVSGAAAPRASTWRLDLHGTDEFAHHPAVPPR
jgi:hypothetical protein